MNTNGLERVVAGSRFLDCGEKRSAMPLWEDACEFKSSVAAVLCRRSPKFSDEEEIRVHLCPFVVSVL